VTTKSSINMCT